MRIFLVLVVLPACPMHVLLLGVACCSASALTAAAKHMHHAQDKGPAPPHAPCDTSRPHQTNHSFYWQHPLAITLSPPRTAPTHEHCYRPHGAKKQAATYSRAWTVVTRWRSQSLNRLSCLVAFRAWSGRPSYRWLRAWLADYRARSSSILVAFSRLDGPFPTTP